MKNQPLAIETVVARRPEVLSTEVDDEVVALNIERGTCYGLNVVGSHVWRLVSSPARVGDICTQLIAEFEVEPAECQSQVLELLEELRGEGLIVTHDRS